MNLFEYQAKELLDAVGIPAPRRRLIKRPEDLNPALTEVGLPCMLKAQVLQGGRGKSGLIQLAVSKTEATKKVRELFALPGKTPGLLIEEKLDIAKEFYLSVTVEPASGSALVVASTAGGVEVEKTAHAAPETFVNEKIDLFYGFSPFHARNIAYRLGLEPEKAGQVAVIISALYRLFCNYDAELVEINPLALNRNGNLAAADAKIIIDDNSLYRHPEYSLTREYFDSDLEYEAVHAGFPYLQFKGNIGIMCAGAGLTNTIYDLIHDYGGSAANYLEFGGPNYTRAVEAMAIALKNKPDVLLIVTFGTIARADVMARGIAEAVNKLNPDIPIVTAIRGTGEEEAIEVLKKIGLEPLQDTEDAVRRAVELAAEKRNGYYS